MHKHWIGRWQGIRGSFFSITDARWMCVESFMPWFHLLPGRGNIAFHHAGCWLKKWWDYGPSS